MDSKAERKVVELNNPFDGIDYFRFIDQEPIQAVEEGEKDRDVWKRYEFYPRVGYVRIVRSYRDNKGELAPKYWSANLRTQEKSSPHGTPHDEDVKFIQDGLEYLNEHGVDTSSPAGYPEVEDVLVEATSVSPKSYKDLVAGHYYLVFDQLCYKVYRHGGFTRQPRSNSQDFLHAQFMPDEVFGSCDYLEIVSNNFKPIPPATFSPNVFTLTVPTNWQVASDNTSNKNIYELTAQQARAIAQLRPAEQDMEVGIEWSREKVCVHSSIQGLQYERFGKDEYGYKRPSYNDVTRENYQQAISIIITRFGPHIFAQTVEEIMTSHLDLLHTPTHEPRTAFGAHSDISPIPRQYMKLARQVINNSHPLPNDMLESGQVVNVKTLFGDADFWNLMRNQYPDLFNRFVNYLQALPRQYEQHGINLPLAIIDPVALIKQYFPLAYAQIVQSRPDFDSDTPEAILV